MSRETRRGALLAGLGLTAAACAATPQTSDPLVRDPGMGRVTVGVYLNDQGPFTFALDCAANASVIASDLAERMTLPRGPDIGMHTLIAREVVGTARLQRVRAGVMDVRDVNLAIGSRAGLAGVDGLLGTDLLKDLRVDLRFGGMMRARISQSRRDDQLHYRANSRTLRAIDRRPDGLMRVEARAGQAVVHAIVDTGALVSVANPALAAQAPLYTVDLGADDPRESVYSPTGRSLPAKAMFLPQLDLAGLLATNLTILSGDFHTFRVWELTDTPAMLLGVDILRLFRAVSIDLRLGEMTLEV